MPLLDKISSLKGDKFNGTSHPPEKQAQVIPPSFDAPAMKEAPPSYAPEYPSTNEGPSAEELNAAFTSLNLEATSSFPTSDQCLAHLKLLSAFHVLKEDIQYTDGMFNLWDAKFEFFDNRDELLQKLREKRWALYVARATSRFEAWWLQILCNRESSKRIEGKEMVATNLPYVQFTQRGKVQSWTPEMLPPLGELLGFYLKSFAHM